MAYSLEARSPLLDHELMEMAAAIPPELKLRGRRKKAVLRDALRAWLPRQPARSAQAGVLDPGGALVPGRPARLRARGPARPVHARARVFPPAGGRGAARPARGRQPPTSPRESGRLLVLELWQREIADRIATPDAGERGMRILMLVYGRLGEHISGPEIRGLALARELAVRHEVTVAIGDGSGEGRPASAWSTLVAAPSLARP